ncbi:MAG: TolC family protein [Ignavibacteriaceae bacterium]|nr:TolC family protein [Ignavibacterium sp.]MCC6253353.1 TolC family protein [Ignavibacteriaceae bacterium]HRN27315.1 TolC family protein [Ignavibacteriaceae bacterium]HRP92282.1 TolC family protein [Ignavibacteriaceae bacterium]HRQ53757.1 TolC family protein [Ignavibacteriaceae bacterium]
MKFFLVSILFLISTNYLLAQKELTLDQAIKIALQKNTGLITQENEIARGETSVDAAYGNFLPNLNASASFDWNRSEEAGRITNINGVNIPAPKSTSESRTYGVGANSNIVLFDGLSNYANLSRSKNNLEALKLSIEGKKQEVVFQTINLYYSVVEADQLLKVREEDVKQQQKNLETIEERNRLGSLTKADVYQQQVQTGNAELQVIQQKNILENSKSNLLFYLGLDVLENFSFSNTLTNKELKILDTDISTDFNELNDLVNKALLNRRDYLAQKLNLDSYYDNVTIARSGHLPRLSGNLGYGSYSNSIGNLFDSHNYSAGLTLSIPIFSGFATHNAIQSAEVDAMNYELQVNDTERLIKQNLQKTFLDLEAAKKSLSVTEKNVKAAEENLKIEQEKYNLGAGKLLDVLIANTSYQNAKTNYINAQFYYIRLSEQLRYNLGVLDYSQYE